MHIFDVDVSFEFVCGAVFLLKIGVSFGVLCDVCVGRINCSLGESLFP